MTCNSGSPIQYVSNNPTYKVVNGITYFKLRSEFEGDYTKNCGLLGEEIDANFYFLRGYDIECVYLDEERNLVIQRVDKDYAPIKVNLNEEFKKTTFYFDKVTGTLVVTYPDGTEELLRGFLVQGKDIKIATDSTLDGNGSIFKPLGIADVETTGTYAPASEFYDITMNIGHLPNPETVGKGYRVVSKETIDNFGCLYTYDAVRKISEKLEETGSEWRVPTKDDWDDLLNSLECPEDRNHSSSTCTWLGRVAGAGMKSEKPDELWRPYAPSETSDTTVGRDVYGLSVYPLGITPDRNEILGETCEGSENYDAEGFGKITGFWTNTQNAEGNTYVKLFGYNHADVDQDTYGKGARMSLRLVKDYHYDNCNEVETILGQPYPTVLVHGYYEDCQYSKIWTKINFYSSAYDGIRSKEWSAVTAEDRGIKTVYYINESDGYEWHKKPMGEGDSVVILDYVKEDGSSIRYHEWRVVEGELVDTLDSFYSEFEEKFKELHEKIEAETDRAIEAESSLNDAIHEERERAISVETAINDELQEEIERSIAADTELNDKIEAEKKRAIEAETAINNDLQAEKDRSLAADTELNDKIEAEKKRAIEAESSLNAAIHEEKERAISVETAINNDLQAEKDRSLAADTELNDKIEAEIARAEAAENMLSGAIDTEREERIANDIVPGDYILSGDSDSRTVIPTSGADVQDVTLSVSEDFFNFGTF